jgi:hypothetical protein
LVFIFGVVSCSWLAVFGLGPVLVLELSGIFDDSVEKDDFLIDHDEEGSGDAIAE